MDVVKKHREPELSPVIREMVRTRVTPPNIVLLIDKIIIVEMPSTDDDAALLGAYRMYLTDREKSIQALFKRKIHKQIVDLDIREGSFIALTDYKLMTASRLNGKGKVEYLAISDFYWKGEEIRDEQQTPVRVTSGVLEQRPEITHDSVNNTGFNEAMVAKRNKGVSNDVAKLSAEFNREDTAEVEPLQDNQIEVQTRSKGLVSRANDGERKTKQDETDKTIISQPLLGEISVLPAEQEATQQEQTVGPVMPAGGIKSAFSNHNERGEKRKRAISPSGSGYGSDYDSETFPRLQTKSARKYLNDGSAIAREQADSKVRDQKRSQTQIMVGRAEAPGLKNVLDRGTSSWAIKAAEAGKPLQSLERPPKLSTLASVTGRNCSRNKVVDILAIVDSVDDSTTKPAKMPLKRDMRIMDDSTERKVPLSIFVNPHDCKPTVGDVVLLRNVVTHDFKGGNLAAYPKYCGDKDWCIPNPCGRYLGLEETRRRILADVEENHKRSGR